MRSISTRMAAAGASMVLAAAPAGAEDGTADGPALWEIGGFAGAVSQQAYPGSDQQVRRAIALPYFVYRGEFLRADRGSAGIRALRTPSFEVDIGVAGSFAARSDEIEARRGMRELGTLIEFGPRLKWRLAGGPGGDPGIGVLRLDLPVRGVFDLSDGAAFRGVSFEPELVFQRRADSGWRYATSVGAVLGDRRLAHTFYGVGAADATPGRPAYAARSGLIAWRAEASASRRLSADWRVFGYARIDSVAGAANRASPLVRQTNGATVGIGVAYTFMRSTRPAVE